MKKAQVSLFLIGAALIALVFFLSTPHLQKRPVLERTSVYESDRMAIDSFVRTCADDALEGGIRTIANQGGYFVVEEPLVRFENYSVPLYVHDGQINVPSKDRIIRELENYIENHVANCLSGLLIYHEQGYNITIGAMNASISIRPDGVDLYLTLPLEFHKPTQAFSLSEFSASSDFDMGKMHEATQELIASQQLNIQGIPFSSLSNLALKYGFHFELVYLNERAVLYRIIFSQEPQEVSFNFIAEYEWTSIPDGNQH